MYDKNNKLITKIHLFTLYTSINYGKFVLFNSKHIKMVPSRSIATEGIVVR